jgi:hypothetical protein
MRPELLLLVCSSHHFRGRNGLTNVSLRMLGDMNQQAPYGRGELVSPHLSRLIQRNGGEGADSRRSRAQGPFEF